jgi:PTH1 family peptidyl-tRNA hydrolase
MDEVQAGGQISNLIIVHDDLDIPLGKFKIQFGKGPRLHNGVLSVEQALGTKEFWRIRIGIDGRKKEEGRRKKEEGEEYVLEKFKPDEKKVLEAVFPEIRDKLLKKGPTF